MKLKYYNVLQENEKQKLETYTIAANLADQAYTSAKESANAADKKIEDCFCSVSVTCSTGMDQFNKTATDNAEYIRHLMRVKCIVPKLPSPEAFRDCNKTYEVDMSPSPDTVLEGERNRESEI